MLVEQVGFEGGRLPSKQALIYRKIGDLMEHNLEEAQTFTKKFKPNKNQQFLADSIEASEVPKDKWLHYLVYGPTGCTLFTTFILYEIHHADGSRGNHKGGTIQRLYERFHRIQVGGKGKNRIVPWGSTFHVSTADPVTGEVKLGKIVDVLYSGVKEVFRVTTTSGKSIATTECHPFLTSQGYRPLRDLRVGDKVWIHDNAYQRGRSKRKHRHTVCVKWHPTAGIKVTNGCIYYQERKSRIVMEAALNGLTFEGYVQKLNGGYWEGIKVLEPGLEVHHIDGDCQNDELANLEILTIAEHHAVHEEEAIGKLRRVVTSEEIVSIKLEGSQPTYDITMEDEPNFVADGFVVHNSGKSIGVYAYVIDKLLRYPGARALGIRRTTTDIKDSIYADTIRLLNKFGVEHTANATDTTIYLRNGSVFRMRSDKALVDPNSDKSHSLGSTAYNFVVYEEADSLSQELIITMAGRMRAPGNYRKVLFYICNPPSKRHWLWKMFHDENEPYDPKSRRRVLYCGVDDNIAHVGTGYVESMREDFGMNTNLLKRLGYGLPGADTKGIPYFAEDFNRDIHVSPTELTWDPAYPVGRGWDFGFIGTGLVVFQFNPDLNQFRFFESILGQDVLFGPFCDVQIPLLQQKYGGVAWEDYCDASGRNVSGVSDRTFFDMMRERGMRPRYPNRRGLAWSLGLVSTLLRTMYKGKPKFIIDPRAEILIEALEGGYCNMKGVTDDDVRPKKDGVYDHIMDAMRYPIMCLRSTPDEGVRTRDGYVTAEPSRLFQQDLSQSRVARGSVRGAIQGPGQNPFRGRGR